MHLISLIHFIWWSNVNIFLLSIFLYCKKYAKLSSHAHLSIVIYDSYNGVIEKLMV